MLWNRRTRVGLPILSLSIAFIWRHHPISSPSFHSSASINSDMSKTCLTFVLRTPSSFWPLGGMILVFFYFISFSVVVGVSPRFPHRSKACIACGENPVVKSMKDSEAFASRHGLTVDRRVSEQGEEEEEEVPAATCQAREGGVCVGRPLLYLSWSLAHTLRTVSLCLAVEFVGFCSETLGGLAAVLFYILRYCRVGFRSKKYRFAL